jgi:DNA polymerase-4
MPHRKIIHIDMDCFYAAVEEKYNPQLKGVPMAVGGSPQSRSVICTANYEARKFGVKAALPSSRAVRLCPRLVLVPPNFELYSKESGKVREILNRFANRIEPLSLDEAYLDVTGSSLFQGSATLIAQEIRRQIQMETGLTASAGVASNKFLAKIASDWRKPNGQFLIRPEDVAAFMVDLPIEKIWGVGKVTAARMHELNLRTCGDLQKLELPELKRFFGGSRAQELFQLCRGFDERPVETQWERKSLSVEETFHRDLESLGEILQKLPSVYEDWKLRLNKKGLESQIRSAVVKFKYHDFKNSTHEKTLKQVPTIHDFERLLIESWERRSAPIRLLGIGVRFQTFELAMDQGQLQFAV